MIGDLFGTLALPAVAGLNSAVRWFVKQKSKNRFAGPSRRVMRT